MRNMACDASKNVISLQLPCKRECPVLTDVTLGPFGDRMIQKKNEKEAEDKDCSSISC